MEKIQRLNTRNDSVRSEERLDKINELVDKVNEMVDIINEI